MIALELRHQASRWIDETSAACAWLPDQGRMISRRSRIGCHPQVRAEPRERPNPSAGGGARDVASPLPLGRDNGLARSFFPSVTRRPGHASTYPATFNPAKPQRLPG